MKFSITATELARKLGDVLGKVRFRRDTFVIERNGDPVARLTPVSGSSDATVAEALRAWIEAPQADAGFPADLERVNNADRPPVVRP